MDTEIKIIPIVPFDDGRDAGAKLGRKAVLKQTRELLQSKLLKSGLGSMTAPALTRYVMDRLGTRPDFARFPELEDIYPERVEYVRGFAAGAECSLEEAAIFSYATYREEIERWYHSLQVDGTGRVDDSHCSGVALVGPDGVLGGHSAESGPPVPKPKNYRFRTPPPHTKWRALKPDVPKELVLRKPRTGYIERWGGGNEKGVACCAGTSCSTWCDDPIEDVWPVGQVPLLRFARNVAHLAELFRRYNLHNWQRSSSVWADPGGNAMVVEKSFRRIGIRFIEDGVLWCTEGHFESPEMSEFIHSRRLQYLRRAGKHLGADDMQYFTDSAVRFTRLGEICHESLGRGYEHINRILTDHATFPRAVCRHGGPDTAPYDCSVTMGSSFEDVTHNRSFGRGWVPWKKFPCEVPWTVTQYPARP